MSSSHQLCLHEQLYQKSRFNDFLVHRSNKERLLHSMPRLNLGEMDYRAKPAGVYVLSRYCSDGVVGAARCSESNSFAAS
jgi:hypothetical protein